MGGAAGRASGTVIVAGSGAPGSGAYVAMRLKSLLALALWVIAMTSVIALYRMGRIQASGTDADSDGLELPDLAPTETSRVFHLDSQRLLAVRHERDSKVLALDWVGGSIEEPELDSEHVDVGGIPERLALLPSSKPSLLALVRKSAGGTVVVEVDLSAPGETPAARELLATSSAVGRIVDFELAGSRHLVFLLESQPGSGRGSLLSVEIAALRGPGAQGRELATDLLFGSEGQVDLTVRAAGNGWDIGLTAGRAPQYFELDNEVLPLIQLRSGALASQALSTCPRPPR